MAKKKKSPPQKESPKANVERAKDALWELLDGGESQLAKLENRLVILYELFSAKSEGGDDADLALMAHVEEVLESFKAARTEIQSAYQYLVAAGGAQ